MSLDNTLTVSQWSKMMLCLIIAFIIFYYWGYKQEIKKHTSQGEIICGTIERIYDTQKGDSYPNGGGSYKMFSIKTEKKTILHFSRGGNSFKKEYSPYWKENLKAFLRMKVNDKICIRYSNIYFEDSIKNDVPYLIEVYLK